MRFGARGPNSAVATACTTGAHAIGDAFRLIQNGYADAMICGGAEAAVTPLAIAGFAAMRALSTATTSRNVPAGRGIAIETASSSGKARGFWCSKRGNSRGSAERRCLPKSWVRDDRRCAPCDGAPAGWRGCRPGHGSRSRRCRPDAIGHPASQRARNIHSARRSRRSRGDRESVRRARSHMWRSPRRNP